MPAGRLVQRLNISRLTLKRAFDALGPHVVGLGQARRRVLRGGMQAQPLFVVDEQGRLREAASVSPLHPAGCALEAAQALARPLEEDLRDGWFGGLPYFLDDMRPQGFLSRNFARHHAALLQVSEHPQDWSEDDLQHAISLLGADQSGNYILGETACRQWLEQSRLEPATIGDEDVAAPTRRWPNTPWRCAWPARRPVTSASATNSGVWAKNTAIWFRPRWRRAERLERQRAGLSLGCKRLSVLVFSAAAKICRTKEKNNLAKIMANYL